MKNLLILLLILIWLFVIPAPHARSQGSRATQPPAGPADSSISRATALLEHSAACYKTGDLAGAIEYTRQVIALGNQTGSNRILASGWKNMAFYERPKVSAQLLQYDSLYLFYIRKRDTLSYLPDALYIYSMDLLNQDKLDKARTLLQEGTSLATARKDKGSQANFLYAYGEYYTKTEDLANAHNSFYASLRLARELNDLSMIAADKLKLAHTAIYKGNSDDSTRQFLYEALEYYHQHNKFKETGDCYELLGYGYHITGNYNAALAAYRQSREYFTRTKYTTRLIDEDLSIVQVYLDKGIPDSIVDFLNEAQKLCNDYDYAKGKAVIAALIAQYHTRKEHYADADASLAGADSINRRLKLAPLKIATSEFRTANLSAQHKTDSANRSLANTFALAQKIYGKQQQELEAEKFIKNYSKGDSNAIRAARQLYGLQTDTGTTGRPDLYQALSRLVYQRDSSSDAISNRQLTEIETKYRTALKDDSLRLASQQNEIARGQIREQQLDISRKNRLIGIIALAAALLITLAILQYRGKRAAEKARVLEEENRARAEKDRAIIETLRDELKHRVDNQLATILSLVDATEEGSTDPASFEILRTRLMPFKELHHLLGKDWTIKSLPMQTYLSNICEHLVLMHQHERQVAISVYAPIELGSMIAGMIGLIVTELIRNAFKYAFQNRTTGNISVSLTPQVDARYCLNVKDDGPGMPDNVKGSGQGFDIVKNLAQELKGELSWRNQDGLDIEIMFM